MFQLTGILLEEPEEEQDDDDVCEPGIGRWKGITGLGEEYEALDEISGY